VLIADDQEIIRHGLELMLGSQPDLAIVGRAEDGEQAVALAARLRPDVVLMDIKMPKRNGIQATRAIIEAAPSTRVIILTTYDTDDLVFEGIRAGASGYLLKGARTDAVVNAIRSAHNGESQLDTAIAAKVVGEFRRLSEAEAKQTRAPAARPDEPAIEQLTERETQVLHLIAEGLANKDIAARLFLSEGTVKNHVSSIMSKLHANDRAQVIVKAARNRLVRFDT
jgi:DNA-binding NarL/FixJ family response regulator